MADLNYTKGKWEVGYLGGGYFIGDGEISIASMTGLSETDAKVNAELIVAAVNACQKVNPDNPLAVAEALPDMYEALKEAINWLAFNRRDRPGTTGSLLADTINQALAKAEGKGEK